MLDARSLVVHDATCWSDAKWDAETTSFATQLWQILPASGTDAGQLSNAPPLIILPLQGSWEARRYDFHRLCLSPYDCIKNTSKMPSDTDGQASLQVLMAE